MFTTQKMVAELGGILDCSIPGLECSHLFLGSPANSPLGRVRLSVTVVALSIDGDAEVSFPVAVDEMARLHSERCGPLYMAALFAEYHGIDLDRKGRVKTRLNHSGPYELVRMCAADRTGRRYAGARYLTGPMANTIDGIYVAEADEPLTSFVDEFEPYMPVLRRVVDI
jgi:hypothetical protein